MTRTDLFAKIQALQDLESGLNGQLTGLLSSIKKGLEDAAVLNDPDAEVQDAVLTLADKSLQLPTPPPYEAFSLYLNGKPVPEDAYKVEGSKIRLSWAMQVGNVPFLNGLDIPFADAEKGVWTCSYVHAGSLKEVEAILPLFPELAKKATTFQARKAYWEGVAETLKGVLG